MYANSARIRSTDPNSSSLTSSTTNSYPPTRPTTIRPARPSTRPSSSTSSASPSPSSNPSPSSAANGAPNPPSTAANPPDPPSTSKPSHFECAPIKVNDKANGDQLTRDASFQDAPISIRDLNDEELDHVIRVFSSRIGLDSRFGHKSPWEVVSLEELAEALSFGDWPDSSATSAELLWCSESLRSESLVRLRNYSVHWQETSNGLRLWIARQPEFPSDESFTFNKIDVVKYIVKVYQVYITSEHRKQHRAAVRKWRLRRFTAMTLSYTFVLIMLGLNSWRISGALTLNFGIAMLLQTVGLTVVASASGYATRRLGVVHGMLTLTVAYLFLLYFVIVAVIDVTKIDLPQWPNELLALGLSLALGHLVAELQNPLKSLGQMLSEGGWKVFYRDVLATPAII